MRNFIKLQAVLNRIPKALFEESPESDFLDWMLDGLKLLPTAVMYEPKIELFEIIDGKVQLPKYVKQINSVSWQASDPTEECWTEFQATCGCEDEPNDTNEQICKPAITYKQWLDSPYYKDNYTLLRYTGTDKSLISSACANLISKCYESFVVTPQKTMYLTLDTGFICVNYDSPVCDDNGDILIPDVAILHEFLVNYAIHKHWENRQFTKEEQAGNFYQAYLQKQVLLLRQAKGDHLLRNFNIANLLEITGGQYKKLIQLPEILFYAR
jgi:hypothetical protein